MRSLCDVDATLRHELATCEGVSRLTWHRYKQEDI